MKITRLLILSFLFSCAAVYANNAAALTPPCSKYLQAPAVFNSGIVVPGCWADDVRAKSSVNPPHVSGRLVFILPQFSAGRNSGPSGAGVLEAGYWASLSEAKASGKPYATVTGTNPLTFSTKH